MKKIIIALIACICLCAVSCSPKTCPTYADINDSIPKDKISKAEKIGAVLLIVFAVKTIQDNKE